MGKGGGGGKSYVTEYTISFQNFDLAVVAMTAILDYLNKQNRPYSAVDIFNNLHKTYGKTVSEERTFVFCNIFL